MKRILCMGSINMDMVMFMKRLPKNGETVVTDNFGTFPGGKAANQAVTVSRLGGQVSFLGKLGDDSFSLQLIESLRNANVNVDSILIEKNESAGITLIRVDEKGENSISFFPGANAKLSIDDVEKNESLFNRDSILLITTEVPRDCFERAICTAYERKMIIVVDPAPVPSEGIPDRILKRVDIIKPNETEAELLTGIQVIDKESIHKALLRLFDKGIKFPIITLGSEGCAYLKVNEVNIEKPPLVDAIDTTAAGDVFSGAMVQQIALDNSIEDAVKYAVVASAISTTKRGAQSSIPMKKEVDLIYSNKTK